MDITTLKLLRYTCLPEWWTEPYPLTLGKAGDAGIDLPAAENIRLKYGKITLVHAGLCFELPPFTWGEVKPRSSMAKAGVIAVPNVIDNGYRGEIIVGLLATEPYVVRKGERIAQFVLYPLITPQLEYTLELDTATERGIAGFGSTGK